MIFVGFTLKCSSNEKWGEEVGLWLQDRGDKVDLVLYYRGENKLGGQQPVRYLPNSKNIMDYDKFVFDKQIAV